MREYENFISRHSHILDNHLGTYVPRHPYGRFYRPRPHSLFHPCYHIILAEVCSQHYSHINQS